MLKDVKAYMKAHEEEVKRVQGRYDELKNVSTKELLDTAFKLGAEANAKIRDTLISLIIGASA